MTILPLTYLGSAAYFARLLQGDCVVDIHENWVKQTARNRCDIVTANGPAVLTVPVHGYGEKIPARDIRIDNSKRWQHQHWVSFTSSYSNSPFFYHYAERFVPFYEQRFEFLLDFNLGLTKTVLDTLGAGDVLRLSEKYIAAAPEDTDLRGKKALRPENETLELPAYMQVFPERWGFIPGMSVIDLLFCESAGPALGLMARCSYRR